MDQIILVIHLLVALAIIGLIMLQQGKGADMGASFGAGASQTLFGSTGSGNVLTKATAWLSVLFFATSFGLALIASQRSAPTNDLGLEIPPVVQEQAVQPALDSDVPVVENDAPAASSTEDDVPEL
ncbi:preprotein translocase subunit SecG [Parahalioglobus pacificus]|uniref:Protein-export membrane protein SecG n=1 Tax=Parahalioglobus pacificus TaxID=930806 RepID=A0A918XLC8_9GAMM|nr:preprotein translocase subunit SecG [Halioglobus pacificus]GHD37284.1 protein-export membrane protein SecG [Halioglobus pacificus]